MDYSLVETARRLDRDGALYALMTAYIEGRNAEMQMAARAADTDKLLHATTRVTGVLDFKDFVVQMANVQLDEESEVDEV